VKIKNFGRLLGVLDPAWELDEFAVYTESLKLFDDFNGLLYANSTAEHIYILKVPSYAPIP
jgi:hypothetical protein